MSRFWQVTGWSVEFGYPITCTSWRLAVVPVASCSAPVSSSTGTLEPGWLIRKKAKSSSGLDEELHAWST